MGKENEDKNKKRKDSGPKRTPPVIGNPGPQPQTQRRFKPKPVYKDRIIRIVEENDTDMLNKRRDMVQDALEKIVTGAGSTIGTAAAVMNKEGLPTRRTRSGAKRGGKMSTGGEVDVIDMTTEIDV
mgnify:CR=1 FL=1